MLLRMIIAITLFSVMQTGCSTFAPNAKQPSADSTTIQKPMPSNANGPARLVVFWKETNLQPPGSAPVRGFTGRIYFHNTSDELVKVDGELVVYAYDDSDDKRGVDADRKYVFSAEKFQTHYSASELGHSYAVWVPWNNLDGIRKSISLVPAFRTTSNQIIQGGVSRLTLSGRAPQQNTVDRTVVNNSNSIRQSNSNYQDSRHLAPDGSQRLRKTETLQIPTSISNRMVNVPQNRISTTALHRLTDMESPEINPNGELYNRVQIQSQSIPAEQLAPNTSHSFSDRNDQRFSRSPSDNSAAGNRTFGKPGTFR